MSLARNIRIHYECKDGIEKSVPRITNWHCEACLTNMVAKMATASMRGSRGGWGSGHHLKNHKVVGLLNNTGPDPLKNHKKNKPASDGLSATRQRKDI